MLMQIGVSLSSYLARVSERISQPHEEGHDGASTPESRLGALKAVLTQVDAFGIQGAESVDEAQVTGSVWSQLCRCRQRAEGKVPHHGELW